MRECLEEEIEELKAEVKQKSEQINSWRRLWVLKGNTVRELRATLSNTKAELSDARSDLADTRKTLDNCLDTHVKMSKANSELGKIVANTKAELSGVRSDLADTTKTLDKYRDMHVKMSRANSGLRKSVADLNETLEVRTEERDLARDLFQGMASAYADLLDRYAESCDDYDELAARFIWR